MSAETKTPQHVTDACTVRYGIPLMQIGEDGDVLILGHDHQPRRTRQPRSVTLEADETLVIEEPSVRYLKRHLSEKPLRVVEPLVRECTPPGGLVLDPMAGSGSTLEAARNLGRRAIGIEADESACEQIALRLQSAQLELAR